MSLNEYILAIESIIQSSVIVVSYLLHVDRKTEEIAFLYGRIDLVDGSVLDFKEFVEESSDKTNVLKYGYNFRSGTKTIFRYDNAPDPRAKVLNSYPHHKHTNTGKIVESDPVSLAGVLLEIEKFISAV